LLRTTPPFALKAVGKDADAESVPSDAAYGAFDFWSPGAAAAEVEVDLESGEFRVTSFAVSADAGAVIHYSSARAQLEGGAVMGFGLALTEELVYGEGQTLNADSFQYRLPQMQDLPQAFATVIEESGRGPGPFGSKGIAQVSIPCVAPAIANAIADATGVVITSMPITAEKILRALGKL
jgi:CO/xanthine dehydrogenase Mo-binding subunit